MPAVLLLLLLAPAVASAQPTLAVLRADAPDAAAIDAGLRAALAEHGGHTVQPAELTAAHVSSAAQMGVACAATDSLCARKLAVLAEVDLILVPRVEGAVLVVELLEGATEGAPLSARRPLDGDPARAAREAVVALFSPERALGKLEVVVQPKGARVLVDGAVVGMSPLAAPIAELEPGPHTVGGVLEGYDQAQTEVVVPFGGSARVELVLRRAQEPHAVVATPPPEETTPVGPATTTTPVSEENANVLALAGLGIAGTGAAVSVLAIATALTLEGVRLNGHENLKNNVAGATADVPNSAQLGAIFAWVTSMVGGGVLVVGGVIYGAAALTE